MEKKRVSVCLMVKLSKMFVEESYFNLSRDLGNKLIKLFFFFNKWGKI